ncbi:MAG: Asp-tRNA(Asn)/Glu-tRNA(Gln) amidotransferase subunit GatC [Candidatus Moranbacteria bacterium]|nr:Asp-tRNA(Asn)/Glu-tRNA(Gln) amidotransferase subunit GatC [Candidatus Moranbacteria bacterium]
MLDKNEVKHIANLARIGITEKEMDKFSHDLSSILDWIAQLEEVDVTGVLPTAHITGMSNNSREDSVSDFAEKEKIVALFPESRNGYDKVKSVL